MAPIKVDSNNNNNDDDDDVEENGDGGSPEPPAPGIGRDDSVKAPMKNETNDFDVSDCFSDTDFEERKIIPKKNGSFVNIEADLFGGGKTGSVKKEEPVVEVDEVKCEVKLTVKEDVKPVENVSNSVPIVIDLSDDDKNDEDSQDSLETRYNRIMAKAAAIVKVECENEDPEIVQLKKDLYQNQGEIIYDLDLEDDDEPTVKVETKITEETPSVVPKKEEENCVVVIKKEPVSPAKQVQEPVKTDTEDIPTIDLTSSDEEIEVAKKENVDKKRNAQSGKRLVKNSASNTSVCSEYFVVKAEVDKLRIRKKKRKSKKHHKRRKSSSDCELIEETASERKVSVEEPVDEVKPPVDRKDVELKDESPAEGQTSNRRRSDESDYVKATIAKELQTSADNSEQKAEEDESGPLVSTDLALEDLLNDFLETGNVPQNPSQVLFPTISTDEDKLLDCEQKLLAELDSILKDDKPLPDKVEEPPNQKPPLFTYTIYDSGLAPLNITIQTTISEPNRNETPPEPPERVPKPRFRIINGRDKYPPPGQKIAKKRPGRPPKVPDAPPKPAGRRRYESDEEYIPSFARTRRVPLRPRRTRRSAPRALVVPAQPTGCFLETPDEEAVQPAEEEPEEDVQQQQKQQPECQSPVAAEDGVYMSMPSLEGELLANAKMATKSGRKRGRPQLQKQLIEDYFGPTPGDRGDGDTGAECHQPALAEPPAAVTNGGKKPPSKRRKKRLRINSNSSSDDDDDGATTMESVSLAGTTSSSTTATVRSSEVEQQQQPKTDEMRVVLSPLTDEKIEKLRSKCNTPKKVRALSKASQTEVQGLTWSIRFDQIDFYSEYFVKLYHLISNGREVHARVNGEAAAPENRRNNFEGVVMAGRSGSSAPVAAQQPRLQSANDHARSEVQQLLFQRAIDEVDLVAPMRVDPAAREQSERKMRTNFRIPKIGKQPSRSPQDVTSSTQHDIEFHCKEEKPKPAPVVGGYSNDQPVAPSRWNVVVVAEPNGNHLFTSRPEDEPRNPGPDASRAMSFRRTIRNDNVQQPLPPVDSGFPAYGVPEQAPPQYRAASNSFGSYMAPNQEPVDVKPNLFALVNQAAMMGGGLPGMMNSSTRNLEMLTMLLMQSMQEQQQQQQQQMKFPSMYNNALYGGIGQMMMGPAFAAMMAHNQQALPPEPVPTSSGMGRRFGQNPVPEPPASAGSVQPNENSEHISQLLGCYDHLMGRCIKNPCQFSHTLPTEATLFQHLMNSAQDVVMATYNFVKARDNLFLRYFAVYAEVMGRRNLRHQLVDTVVDCEKSKRAFSYYRYIVEGLMINGTLSRARAVQFVLEKHTKVNFDQINVLVSLIIDTADEIPQFLQWLEEFSRVHNYQYEVASINRLVEFCVRCSNNVLHSSVVGVAKLTYRLLLGVAPGKEPRVNPGQLLEFAQLLMKSNVGLDVEEIVSKYRANEMSDRR